MIRCARPPIQAVRRPILEDLPQPLRDTAGAVARALAGAGHRGWIVGGTVRDLALGRTAKDLDMASAATPDQAERLFPAAVGVGRAFGTLVLPAGRVAGVAVDVELTTFRGDGSYADGRRPDAVTYGVSLEADAARRDFTANALYLDPLDGTVADPTGGLADLERGLLRTVGDPVQRFREDALRLLRLGRFAARYGLDVPEDVLAAAERERGGLARVSGERVHAELARMGAFEGSARAVALLDGTGALGATFDSWRDRARAARRLALVRALGDGPGVAPFLAALLWGEDPEAATDEYERLRPSRAERRAVAGLWRLTATLGEPRPARARLLRELRELDEDDALRWARALAEVDGARFDAGVRALEAAACALPAGERRPAALLAPGDLSAAGLPRGPLWGQVLAEHEDRRLEGEHGSREEALAWLARRAAQLGGNTRRR